MSWEYPRQWRLLETGAADGSMNMAVDEAILIHHSRGEVPPTLRFYRWHPPALSLGYFQDPEREVDRAACSRQGIGLVRRPTGGRAVLHDNEVTYSVVIAQKYLPGSIVETYRVLSGGLLAGLRLLGVPATLYSPGKKHPAVELTRQPASSESVCGSVNEKESINLIAAGGVREHERQEGNQSDNVRPGRRGHLSAACFDAPSWYEVSVDGKKLVGSAQVRRLETILQHGSILISLDAQKLFSVLNFSSEKLRERVTKTFAARATALDRELSVTPSYEQVYCAMSKGFEQALGIALVPGELTAQELKTAGKLKSKYSLA